MKKPDINDVLRIMQAKKELDDRYEELDNLVAQLEYEYGSMRFDYELPDTFELHGDVVDFVREISGGGQNGWRVGECSLYSLYNLRKIS